MLKENKGITLVALVVTIIVLLILAGVTISLVLGQDGIFNKANTASETTRLADARDAFKMALMEAQVEQYDNTGAQTGTKVTNTGLESNATFTASMQAAGYTVPAAVSGEAGSYTFTRKDGGYNFKAVVTEKLVVTVTEVNS